MGLANSTEASDSLEQKEVKESLGKAVLSKASCSSTGGVSSYGPATALKISMKERKDVCRFLDICQVQKPQQSAVLELREKQIKNKETKPPYILNGFEML